MEARRAVETVWRMESARLIAGLLRLVRDVGLAEDLAHDALVAALDQWPDAGVPANPGAWLMTVAKRRAVDHIRRAERERRAVMSEHGGTSGAGEEAYVTDFDAGLTDHVEDDLLRLIFICCHPVLSLDAQVSLTLRLVGGLTTKEIARSFLTSEPTIAQRVSRAKRTIADARVPYEEPSADARAERLDAVLRVLYLIFNEGFSATAGADWMRPALCQEAMRLGRLLTGLVPDEGEAHGLIALMELQASRLGARVDATGAPVLLLDQDRRRWDRLLIRRGLAALERAEQLGAGPYTVQAAIAACHARARTAADTDWARMVALYDLLPPSPVVALNRAVAVSMADGPAAGLALVDQLRDVPALRDYHLLPSVRGDLLAKLGRTHEARAEFERAARLTRNEREKALLRQRGAQ